MAETEFKYDVFVSYSSANKEWVRKDLLSALEDAGLKVCIDFRDFKAGKPAIKNMRDSVLESKHTLLVLTQAYLDSGWADFENMLSQTIDPANRKGRVVPMLKEKCKLPLEIGYLTYVNFYNPDDWDVAWKQLLEALGSPVTPPPVPVDIRWFYGHRYGDLENFTGRADELQMLDEWLGNDKDNLLVLTAFGGFGKSALTWQWFNNRVDKSKWQTAIWWSFYEKESGFESFLTETLAHLGVEVKASARSQLNDLLEAMCGTNILIVLDGFERLLRQYGRMDAALHSDDEDAEIDPSQRDCSSPLTETFLRGLSGAGMKSKVLMTTRLCPRVLESADSNLLKGCREAPLAAMNKVDAVELFHKQGIKARRDEIEAVCETYGYHPLSLSLLIGVINKDHKHKGDIVVARNLDIFGKIKIKDKRHHVLEYAYKSLLPEHRELLSKISCFRGSMEYTTIKKVFDSPDLENALIDLRERGLLQYVDETQRYDMHPIVRHYAYDHFTDEKRRKEAHVQLAEHFIDNMPVTNTKVKTLEDLAPVIELYHHMVGAGNLDEACDLFYDRINQPTYYQFGAYQLQIELLRALFLDGEDKPPRLKKENDQGWIVSKLSSAYNINGQPIRSVKMGLLAVELAEKDQNKNNIAVGLGNVGLRQIPIGALSAAEHNLRRRIDLCREIEDEDSEGTGHYGRSRVLAYAGQWEESEKALNAGEELKKKTRHIQGQGIIWSYRALRFLLMARDMVGNNQSQIENLKSAIECAQRALKLADETTRIRMKVPRDYVRTHWLLGAAYRASVVSIRRRWSSSPKDVSRPAAYSTTELESLTLAEENLSKALNLCRQINAVDHEADILLDVARLRYSQGDFKDAQEKASEALLITERCGYVLQGADVNLFLAQYALEQEKDKVKAKAYAEEALKLATCDGPPYYYKVAYDEAERLLEKFK